jgi:hypothetical protein
MLKLDRYKNRPGMLVLGMTLMAAAAGALAAAGELMAPMRAQLAKMPPGGGRW